MKEKRTYRKFSLEEQISIIGSVTSGSNSCRAVSALHGIEAKVLRYWIAMYQSHGISGLQLESKSYSAESKLHVLQFMETNDLTLPATAVKFKLSLSAIKTWRHRYQKCGFEGLHDKKRGRKSKRIIMSSKKQPPQVSADQDSLIVELERLRAENAYLKKLQALIQNRQFPRNKKK